MKIKNNINMYDLIIASEYINEGTELVRGWEFTSRTDGFSFSINNNEWGIRVGILPNNRYNITEIIHGNTLDGFEYSNINIEQCKNIYMYEINKFLASVIKDILQNVQY